LLRAGRDFTFKDRATPAQSKRSSKATDYLRSALAFFCKVIRRFTGPKLCKHQVTLTESLLAEILITSIPIIRVISRLSASRRCPGRRNDGALRRGGCLRIATPGGDPISAYLIERALDQMQSQRAHQRNSCKCYIFVAATARLWRRAVSNFNGRVAKPMFRGRSRAAIGTAS
jgi:hypothetical protein